MLLTCGLVTPPAGARTGYHHGDLRNALEAAALALVAERGVHGFSLAEASRRAGVSVSAPFKHFDGKEALLAALALRGYTEQARIFAAAIGSSEDPVEQLAEFAAAYVRFGAEEAALFEVTFEAGLDKGAHPELERAGEQVLDAVWEPVAALRRDRGDALRLLHAVAAAAHGYAAFLRQGVFGTDAVLEDVLHQVRDSARTLARDLP